MLRNGYDSLRSVRTRVFEFDGFQVKVQFNPGRLISTVAKVDATSIKERKCFLCAENLPPAQRGILCDGEYLGALQSVPDLPRALHDLFGAPYAPAHSRFVCRVPQPHPGTGRALHGAVQRAEMRRFGARITCTSRRETGLICRLTPSMTR